MSRLSRCTTFVLAVFVVVTLVQVVAVWTLPAPSAHAVHAPLGPAGDALSQADQSRPSATYDTISSNGIDSTSISLTWSESGDYLFSEYVLEDSTSSSNGPWRTVATISSIASTEEVVWGLGAGTTYWWTIVDEDSLGSQQGNALQVTQPDGPGASAALSTESSALVLWGNSAVYGGAITFGSYEVFEAVNGGPSVSLANITSASTQSYAVDGLTQGSTYSFSVDYWDLYFGSAHLEWSTQTSPLTAPSALSATASASRGSADVGQPMTLACIAAGGEPPYNYLWTFGDGLSGSGSSTTHSFPSAGTFDAKCSITDSGNVVADDLVTVTIYALPSVSLDVGPSLSVLEGVSVTFSAMPTGGSGGGSYAWTGLPGGCEPSAGATISCTPSVTGTFEIQVTYVDSNGGSSTTSENLTISASFLGQPAVQGYALVGGSVLLVLIVVVVAVLLLRRRGRAGKAPSPPPSPWQQPPPPKP